MAPCSSWKIRELSPATAAERAEILRGAREVCAASAAIRATMFDVRREAARLRVESTSLRDLARLLRARPPR